jgi:Zn finger protein HypA/HybF involved in hydrogenase expression
MYRRIDGETTAETLTETLADTPANATVCIAVDSKRVPCDVCGHSMEPEHAHYRCPNCHYILPCCGW